MTINEILEDYVIALGEVSDQSQLEEMQKIVKTALEDAKQALKAKLLEAVPKKQEIHGGEIRDHESEGFNRVNIAESQILLE